MSESATIMSQLMLPTDANPWGNVHGGTVMKLVDNVGGVVAARHCRRRVVTARIDEMSFLHPVYVGDLLILKASMNGVGRTSMEVGVRVEAEDLRTGEVTHTATANLVYVALDENGLPAEIPGLIPETDEDSRRMDESRQRRDHRERHHRG